MKKGLSVDKKGNVHVDTAFLEAFVAKGGQVQPTPGAPTDTTDALLNEVGKSHKSSTKTADALHNQVQDAQAPDKAVTKEEVKVQAEAKKAEEAAKRINKNRVSQAEKIASSIKKASDPVLKKVGHSADRFASARTVGGIGLLLFILIFLLFIVVGVNKNGDTRIKQLWYMLVGRAKLVGRRTITPNATPKVDPNTAQVNAAAQSVQDQVTTGNLQGPLGQAITGAFRQQNTNSGF